MSDDSIYYRRRGTDDGKEDAKGDAKGDHWPSLAGRAPQVDPLAWTSTVFEVNRGDLETIRAVHWQRGEEEVITLQWMLNGLDGSRYPVNIPPTPDSF